MEILKKILIWLLLIVTLALALLFFAYFNVSVLPEIQYKKYQTVLNQVSVSDSGSVNVEKQIISLDKKIAQLNKRMQRLTPGNAFLIINTTNNTFELYKNNEMIRQGRCSTGSFINLVVDSTKSFLFETPKGVLTVQNKVTNPVWTKPDWAFIEEGLPVPPQGHSSRREANVLGDYALILGKGYMIHGTLYQRLIGSPVTHGCVRLLDDDLEAVYKTLPIGSKVFIY